jgi:hypothetical protein
LLVADEINIHSGKVQCWKRLRKKGRNNMSRDESKHWQAAATCFPTNSAWVDSPIAKWFKETVLKIT